MELNKIFCDCCKGEIENCECNENQMRFTLQEHMDDGNKYHFCGAECLKRFIINKEFENRFYRWRIVKDEVTQKNKCNDLQNNDV
jgi:hypothetical protein